MRNIVILTFIVGVMVVPAAHATSNPATEAVRLQDVDTNGDGVMSAEESEAYLQRIVREEYAPQRTAPAAQTAPATRQQAVPVVPAPLPAAQATPQTVTAKDPYAAKDEAGKKVPAFKKKEEDMRVDDMKELDINKDGVLSKDELAKSVAKKFGTADKDGDGVLSKEEIDANLDRIKTEKSQYGEGFGDQFANRAKNRYKNADANRDGKLSPEEYKKYSDQYESNFDQDGDGTISKEEFRSEGEKLPRRDFKGNPAR